ncbi:MAG: hypothetical protein HY699_09230 [Deltaproteobacteria bacterium]|nr:hypothetical protein [Deltaproteobacteria bacterium]
MDRVTARSGVPIRLTEERWFHIVENHDDLAGHYDDVLETIEDPDLIQQGDAGALVASKRLAPRRHLAVVYKEVSRPTGFVVTSYFTRRLARREVVWRNQQQPER